MARNPKKPKAARAKSPRPEDSGSNTFDPETSLRVQQAFRALARVAAMRSRRAANEGSSDKDFQHDVKLLVEVTELVERREGASPTGEGSIRSPDTSPRHAVQEVVANVVEMLASASHRGPVRFTDELLEGLHAIVERVGFRIQREVHDQRVRAWMERRFKDEAVPTNLVKGAAGKEMLAREIVGALKLAPGSGKSSQFAFKQKLGNPRAPRNVEYRHVAAYLLHVLSMPEPLVRPLAEFLEKARSRMAAVEGAAALEPLKKALLLSCGTRRTLPRQWSS